MLTNTIPYGQCFLRYLRTRCFWIRNLTRSLRSFFRFLIRQQLVRKLKYRTGALQSDSICTNPQMEKKLFPRFSTELTL